MSASARPAGRVLEKPGPSGPQQEETIPLLTLVMRVSWVVIQLILAYWLAWQAQPFFYQRF
jgi:hypothetical protein